jgi:hypothetical protein
MINPKQLLDDLKRLLRSLEDDIRNRCDERTEINERLMAEYRGAFEAKRTAQSFIAWRDDHITQVAVAWILSYFRFPLSFRDVEEMLAMRGASLSYETVREWCLTFGQTYANGLRHKSPRPGDRWHLDDVI